MDKKIKVSREYMLWNKDKCPLNKPCFLASSSERNGGKKKTYHLSTSVPVFLLSPLLSGIVFVKYPDWNQEGKKFVATPQICTKPAQKF